MESPSGNCFCCFGSIPRTNRAERLGCAVGRVVGKIAGQAWGYGLKDRPVRHVRTTRTIDERHDTQPLDDDAVLGALGVIGRPKLDGDGAGTVMLTAAVAGQCSYVLLWGHRFHDLPPLIIRSDGRGRDDPPGGAEGERSVGIRLLSARGGHVAGAARIAVLRAGAGGALEGHGLDVLAFVDDDARADQFFADDAADTAVESSALAVEALSVRCGGSGYISVSQKAHCDQRLSKVRPTHALAPVGASDLVGRSHISVGTSPPVSRSIR